MVLGGRYRLRNHLARGGMADVWEGDDQLLDRTVAVKILSARLAVDDAYRLRFREEARTAGRLSHPGIAAVYDFGEEVPLLPGGALPGGPGQAAESVLYLVMELVPGRSLAEILTGGAIGTDRMLDVVIQAARALDVAHRNGVVHRDVKPANLMVTPQGQVKVTDFGISRRNGYEPLTATGQLVGTPDYLAPELTRGASATPLSDVYALGVVAYECLAGRRPFSGGGQVAVMTRHVEQPPPPLPATISPDVVRAVMRALGKVPQERFTSAGEFAEVLDRLRASRAASVPLARRPGPVATRMVGSAAGPTGGWGPSGPPSQSTVALLTPTPGVGPRTADLAITGWEGGPPGGPADGEFDDGRGRRRGGSGRRLLTLATVAVVLAAWLGLGGGTGAIGRLISSITGSGRAPTTAATGAPGTVAQPAAADLASVPPVVGEKQATAEAALTKAGFTWTVQRATSTQYRSGRVSDQNPAAGAGAAKGTQVVLTVSTGSGTAQIPDLTGKSAAEASRELIAQGFTVGARNAVDSPDVRQNHVVRTDPPAGNSVAAGTQVDLYVSTGLVEVPDETGRQLPDALAVLRDKLHLNVVVQTQLSDQQAGTVLAQDVRNTTVQQGGQITLLVGSDAFGNTGNGNGANNGNGNGNGANNGNGNGNGANNGNGNGNNGNGNNGNGNNGNNGNGNRTGNGNGNTGPGIGTGGFPMHW